MDYIERQRIPIYIQKKDNNKPSPKGVECSIQRNFFDPSISSPPNEWKMKLESRIQNYYAVCNSEKK